MVRACREDPRGRGLARREASRGAVRFCRASRGRARWRSGRAETGGHERGHSRPQGVSTVPRQVGSRALRSRGPVEALGGARHRRNPRPRPRRQPRRFDAARREEGEASPFSRAQCLGMRDCCRLAAMAQPLVLLDWAGSLRDGRICSCFFGLVHGNDVILVLGLSICICAVELQMYVSVMWRLEYFII